MAPSARCAPAFLPAALAFLAAGLVAADGSDALYRMRSAERVLTGATDFANNSAWRASVDDPYISDWRNRVVPTMEQCRPGFYYPATAPNPAEMHASLDTWGWSDGPRQCEGQCENSFPGCTLDINETTNETITDPTQGNCTNWPGGASSWTCPYSGELVKNKEVKYLHCGCLECGCGEGLAGSHCHRCTSDAVCADGLHCNKNPVVSLNINKKWECTPSISYLEDAVYSIQFPDGIANMAIIINHDVQTGFMTLDVMRNWCTHSQPILFQVSNCPCQRVQETTDLSGALDSECITQGVPHPCVYCTGCDVSFPEDGSLSESSKAITTFTFTRGIYLGCESDGRCSAKAGGLVRLDVSCEQGACTSGTDIVPQPEESTDYEWQVAVMALFAFFVVMAIFAAAETVVVVLRWSRLAVKAPLDPPGALSQQNSGFTFSWSGVGATRSKRVVLEEVSGSVTTSPGRGALVALMGASGGGKTTLLDVLAGRSLDAGTVSLDGRVLGREARREVVNYVPQDPALTAGMTVRQALDFSAALRLGGLSPERRAGRVSWVLKELGLDHVAGSRIGDAEGRGISGGERRRVSIGIELLTEGLVLVLDEPTSGLDAASSLELGKLLVHLASLGRVVIASLHQPRKELIELFDVRIELDGGRAVTSEQAPESSFTAAANGASPVQCCQRHKRRLWPVQVLALWERSLMSRRNLALGGSQAVFVTVIGLLYGLLFKGVGLEFEGVQERLGSIMFTLLFFSYASLQICVAWHVDRVRLRHEVASGHYTVCAYFFAKACAYIFFQCMILPILFTVSSYWTIGYQSDNLGTFLIFLLGLCGTVMAMSGLSLFCASLFREIASGVGMAAGAVTLFILYSGFLRPKGSVPWPLKLLIYISPFSHSFEALAINELVGISTTFDGATVLGTTWLWQFDLDTEAGRGPPMQRLLACVLAYWAMAFLAVWLQLYAIDYRRACPALLGATPAAETSEACLAEGELPTRRPPDVELPKVQVKVAQLSWRGVSVRLPGGQRILESCVGHVEAGSPLVILGPSGCGKTSLLGVLSGDRLSDASAEVPESPSKAFQRASSGSALISPGSGDIRLDGQTMEPTKLRRLSCYARQDETLLPLATVRESCLFAASLHLSGAGAKFQAALVEWMLWQFGLEKVANSRIGGERKRGISGGERRRTSIAVELLAPRPLLLLDEPTSGLDAASALRVGKLLSQLAAAGRVVVCTLHQPQPELLQYFPRMMALAPGGRMAFSGASSDLASHLNAAGVPTPPGDANLADLLLDEVCKGDKVDALCLATERQGTGPGDGDEASETPPIGRPSLPPLRTQLTQVLRRELQMCWREPTMIMLSYASAVVLAVLLGFTFRPLHLDLDGVLARLGLFCCMVWVLAMQALIAIVAWRDGHLCFLREHNTGLYSASVYAISKALVDILVLRVAPPCIFGAILAAIAGLRFVGEAPRVIFMLVILCLTAITAAMFAFAVGACAPRSQWTLPVAAFLMLLHILFSGIFMPVPPDVFNYLSFARASFHAMFSNELVGRTFQTNPKGLETLGASYLKEITGEQWLAYFHIQDDNVRHVVQLLVHAGVYALASCVALTVQAKGLARSCGRQ